MVKGLIY